MKPWSWFYLTFCIIFYLSEKSTAQTIIQRCATTSYDSVLKAQNPVYRKSRERFEELIRQYQASGRSSRITATTITIPVVVHVIHNNQNGTIGGTNNSNISDDQIHEQIRVLNEDYRKKENTNGFNTNPVGADVNIQFVLASSDPNGLVTDGIIRTYSSKSGFDPESDEDRHALATISGWPTDRYLNIWVTTLSGNTIGYAQFPDGTGLSGLDAVNGYEDSDGVFIHYGVFGVGPYITSSIYDLGRTTTHEIGHWLGLLHTWGDTYCGTDYIDDTPVAASANNSSSLSCNSVYSNCTGSQTRNMIENYMDYSPDLCMNIFTQGQKDRIWLTLDLSPRRKKLVEYIQTENQLPESDKLTIRNSYPNPLSSDNRNLRLEVLLKGTQDVTIDIINRLGGIVKTAQYPQISSSTIGIDLTSMAQGLYMVRIRTTNEEKTTKVIVN